MHFRLYCILCHTHDVKSPPALIEIIQHRVSKIIRLTSGKSQGCQTTVDTGEITKTCEEFRLCPISNDRSFTGWSDECRRARTDSFDGFGTKAGLFHVNTWR